RAHLAARSFVCLNLSQRRAICSDSMSILWRTSGVISWACSRAIVSAQRAAQSRIAPGSPDLQARWKSFASFLYCSMLGLGGRGSASDIRSSFHGCAWCPPIQAERRFVTWVVLLEVGTALSADWMRPSRRPQFSRCVDICQTVSFELDENRM